MFFLNFNVRNCCFLSQKEDECAKNGGNILGRKEKVVYIGYSVPESFYGLNFFFTFAVLKVMRNRNKRILCNGKE